MPEIIEEEEEEGKQVSENVTPKSAKAEPSKFVPKKLEPAPWLYPKIKIPYRHSAFFERQPWQVCPDIFKKGRYVPPDAQRNRKSYRSDKLVWDNDWLNKIAYYSTLQMPVTRYNCEYPGTRIGHGVMPPVWLVTPSMRHNTVMTSVYGDRGYPPRGLEFLGQMKPSKYAEFIQDEGARDVEMGRGLELCLSGHISPQAFDRYWLDRGENSFDHLEGIRRRSESEPIRLDQVQYRMNRSRKFNYGPKDSLHTAIDMCKTGAITPDQFEKHWMQPEAYDNKRHYWRKVYD